MPDLTGDVTTSGQAREHESAEVLSGWLDLYNALSTTRYKSVMGEIMTFAGSNGSVSIGFTIRGSIGTTSAITHVKFAASSGNIASGKIRMYGYANS